MAKTSHPDRKGPWGSGGRFLPGEYSPARRSAVTACVPPRASAYPADVVKVRPRYPRVYTDKGTVEQDVTRIPTMPPAAAVWQYETPRYEAESSLPSLSLAISENTSVYSPTIDEIDTAVYGPTIDEIDTAVYGPAIDEINTAPPVRNVATLENKNKESRKEYALVSTQRMARMEKEATQGSPRQEILHITMRHPFDRFRWWLLAPGRIELILWICGTIVLICVTGLLVFMLAASMGFFRSSVPQNVPGSICTTEGSIQNKASNGAVCTLSTAASPSGLRVIMMNGDLMQTGNTLQLQGQGFHPLGHVTLTHDGNLPCQPDMIQANEHGEFAVAIRLDEKKYWGAGKHQITVNDTGSKHSIILTIMLEPQK